MSLRRTLISSAVVAVVAVPFLFAQAGRVISDVADTPLMQNRRSQDQDQKEVSIRANKVYPVYINDTMVICLVGNFAAYHNGAVITCDSAVRYGELHFECFGNVLINKNTTYVYGERADYNGVINEAHVYSDLVKVVDGDATLYTYKFSFNTKTNIGRFNDGGVLVNRDNMMEADRGYYYSDKRDVIGVDRVEMRNETYRMTGDSVIYNIATDKAHFFTNSNIWNDKGDYLYADRGHYDKSLDLYSLTLNGYVLTEKQELWSDTLDYYREVGHAILYSNLQLDDIEHKTLAFGDFGEYWKEPGNVILTRRPSVINYDPEQGDSLFMRADSMFLFTLPTFVADTIKTDTTTNKTTAELEAAQRTDSIASPTEKHGDEIENQIVADSTAMADPSITADSIPRADSVAVDPATEKVLSEKEQQEQQKELTKEERRAQLREIAEKEKLAKKKAAAAANKEKLAEIAAKRQAKATAKLDAQKAREQKQAAVRKQRMEAAMAKRKQKQMERAARKGIPYVETIDSAEYKNIDSVAADTIVPQDSLLRESADSLAVDSAALAKIDSISAPRDSIYRLIKAYRNVKAYRTDFQTVCDSLVAISTDSTIHLYINPVLWNETNQVTSDVMDIFTANQQVDRAEFVGSPMMVTEIDTLHYNQVAGKAMTAFFRNSQIYRNDVNGHAQTIYYMQEKGSSEVENVAIIESGAITFYIDNKAMDKIVYKINPTFKIYPLDKIPADLKLFLDGFKWQGDRRPDQKAVFDRRIRPSIREEKSALNQPTFPVFEQIEAYKKQLIESKRWADRNDQVLPEIVDWMRDQPK